MYLLHRGFGTKDNRKKSISFLKVIPNQIADCEGRRGHAGAGWYRLQWKRRECNTKKNIKGTLVNETIKILIEDTYSNVKHAKLCNLTFA